MTSKDSKIKAGGLISMETNGILPTLRRPKCVSNFLISKPDFPITEDSTRNNGPDELDPNTMEFSQLIDLMHPKFITDYLQRILNFLLDNTSELNFPNIAPFKRAFLERLVKDHNNLKCSRFDRHAKATADRILEVLRSKSQEFKWTHSYENCSVNRGILVYKKQYHNNTKAEFKHPSAIPLKQKSETPKTPDQNSVPTNFKIQCLNSTLKFIKDDSQVALEYPEMTLPMAEFIDSMLNQPKPGLDSYGYKSMYAPLWEALKIFGLKYEFKVYKKSTTNDATTSLTLEKIPKQSIKMKVNENGNRKVTPAPVRSPSPALSTASSLSISSLNPDPSPQIMRPQAYRKVQKLVELIQSIKPKYITDCIRKLLEFTIDDRMGSINILTNNLSEETFLCKLISLAKADDKHWIFYNAADRTALRDINGGLSEAKKKGLWSLSVNFKIVNKEKSIKEAHFKKVPRFMNSAIKQSPSLDIKISENAQKNSTKENPRLKFLKALSVSVDNVSDKPVSNDKEHTQRKVVKSRDSSVDSQYSAKESGRKVNRSNNPITFKSAGQFDPVDQSLAQQIDQPVPSIDDLPRAKKKIFEAMSTPMDSDKGRRMMKLMGWSGGALGARGEGITEPILPAIIIKTGAGLGHIPEPKPPKVKKDKKPDTSVTIKDNVKLPKKLTKAQRTNFRITFLKHLLEHIRSDASELRVEFDALSRNETRFMQIAIQSFNSRRRVGLNTKEEVAYLHLIEEELYNSQYVFNAEVNSLTRSAIIKKSLQPNTNLKPKPVKTKPKPEPKPETDPFTRLQNSFSSRLSILEQIAEFLQSDDLETEFNFVNGKKDKTRLDLVIAVANKRMPVEHTTRRELELYNIILENMKDCCLSVSTDDENKFRYVVRKAYRKKFINSSLQPPNNDEEENDENDVDYIILIDSKTVIQTENSDKENNNNYIKKEVDIEHEKLIFQNEIDIIEKGDGVDKTTQIILENKAMETNTDLDAEIKELENAMRDSNLHTSSIKAKTDLDASLNSTISGKRSRSDSLNSDLTPNSIKKNKSTIKEELLCIVPKNYPAEKITIETVKQIQYIIANKIDTSVFLPAFKCYGIQNGALVYGCHSEKSSSMLQNLIQNSDVDIKIIENDDTIYKNDKKYMLDIKINTFIEQDVCHLFFNLEVFNIGLMTNEWRVVNETQNEDCLIISVEMDEKSYKFIRDHEFELNAGFDKALFRLHW